MGVRQVYGALARGGFNQNSTLRRCAGIPLHGMLGARACGGVKTRCETVRIPGQLDAAAARQTSENAERDGEGGREKG